MLVPLQSYPDACRLMLIPPVTLTPSMTLTQVDATSTLTLTLTSEAPLLPISLCFFTPLSFEFWHSSPVLVKQLQFPSPNPNSIPTLGI